MKKVAGWVLFVSGILGGLYVLILPLQSILEALSSLLEIILSLKLLALIGAGIAIWLGWNLFHRDSKRTLKMKVGGDTIKLIPGAQDEDAKFLEKLDTELRRFNDTFECLSSVDQSVYPDWEKNLVISFQCRAKLCPNRNSGFCKKVITAMEDGLTEKMNLETRIDTGGIY